MRRVQNRRQDLDQAREENQEGQRGECRESLREGKRHAAYFVAASPTLEDGAAESDSRKERREHQRKRCGCWHCCWLATREPECERSGEQIERDGNAECLPQPKRGQKQEARDKCSHNRARCVDPVETREAGSEFG